MRIRVVRQGGMYNDDLQELEVQEAGLGVRSNMFRASL